MTSKIQKNKGTLLGWGRPILERDNFVCKYCGLDGKTDFRIWMQFSIDHVIPKKKSNGANTDNNMVACCRSCNSVTSQMGPQQIPENSTLDEAIKIKRARVAERHREYEYFWKERIATKKEANSIES